MQKQAKRILRYAAATVVLILGILGLFLPFLQGILLIILSLVLFGIIERKDFERLKERWKERKK